MRQNVCAGPHGTGLPGSQWEFEAGGLTVKNHSVSVVWLDAVMIKSEKPEGVVRDVAPVWSP